MGKGNAKTILVLVSGQWITERKQVCFLFKWDYLSMDLFTTDYWKNPCFFFSTYE